MKGNSIKDIESEKILIEELSKHICIRIHNVNKEDKFMEDIRPVLKTELEKSDKNKKKYFNSETAILICSGCSGFFSALGVSGLLNDIFQSIFGIFAAALSVVITILIGTRGLRKWQETWLRHRGHLNKCYEECYLYANSIGKYKGYQPIEWEMEECIQKHIRQREEEALDMFKESIVSILMQNNKDFMKNMKTQTKEQNSQNKTV